MSESRRMWSGWRRTALFGLAAGLVMLVSGDGVRGAGAIGIDPLEVLKLQVRPNVMVVLDSSGSMTEPVTSTGDLGGDHPRSKMAQAKAVLQQFIQDNEAKVSFQFGQYVQPNNSGITLDGTNRFLYATEDPNGALVQINPGGNGGSTPRAKRNRTSDNALDADGTIVYKLIAGRFFNGHTIYALNTGAGCATVTAGVATNPATVTLVTVTSCATLNPDPTVPAVTFTFEGALNWNGVNDANSCGGFQSKVSMAACTNVAQFDTINDPFLLPELLIDPNGGINGYMEGAPPTYSIASQPTPNGIRAAGLTPVANSLLDFKTIFNQLWYFGTPNVQAISLQTPIKQRTFAIVVTDGDDTCPSRTLGSGASDCNARRAAYKAQLLYQRIVPTDVASGVETFVIVFGSGASATRANMIAWGGSGLVKPNANLNCNGASDTAWTTNPTPSERAACITCQDAFVAANAAELSAALQSVIDQAVGQGEFSDAQSIVSTVFELTVDIPGTPNVESAFAPDTRYNQRVNILYQSTFELPGWKGHLFAFLNDGSFQAASGVNSLGIWESGQTLFDQIVVPMQNATRGGRPPNQFTFAELHDGQTVASIGTPASQALIKRRIFTSNGNGRFVRDGSNDGQFDSGIATGTNVVALWPPNQAGLTSGIGNIDPPVPTPGPLDDALGFTGLTFDELKSNFGACDASTDPGSGPLPAACDNISNPPLALQTARKETRQVILAWAAGAQLHPGLDGLPFRDVSSSALIYQDRGWLLGDTTLAAPAIVSPPLRFPPATHVPEFLLYRDGRRDLSGQGIDEISKGFGLRNPDIDDAIPEPEIALKPVMTVVYLGANDMLHAFRAGPECAGGGCEQGSEELWGYLPFDQLGKIQLLIGGQTTSPHTYVLSSSLRVGDVFVPDTNGYVLNGVTYTGRWRTVLYFGRGCGGKYYTALDVTVPGPFTRKSYLANPPWVMWNRGNPDTTDGLVGGPPVRGADTAAYARMGQTWSVPALGNVDFAPNTPEWRLFTGSGYGDPNPNPGEGSTFYELDALTGDVVQSHNLPLGDTTYIADNALVAGPSAYNPRQLDPPDAAIPDPVDRVTRVYYPDVQGRIWKFNITTNGKFYDAGPTQPFGASLALLKISGKAYVYGEAGNDLRVPDDAGPFKMYGLRDDGGDGLFLPGVLTGAFPINFPAPPPSDVQFRGTLQPATAFSDAVPPQPRVFFAGTRFNPAGAQSCLSSFDTILFAVGGVSGGAIYDFTGDGIADLSTIITGKRATGIQTTGGGLSIQYSGALGAEPSPTPNPNPTPTPLPPRKASITTVQNRTGSPVCRTP